MPARTRHDPPSRPADGRRRYDILKNRDPRRHYVVANPNEETTGVAHYLMLGYVVETSRPGGPHFVGGDGVSEGGAVTRLGGVLMSCPIELREELVAQVQDEADNFDRRALKSGNIDDPMRGRSVKGMRTAVDHSETEWTPPIEQPQKRGPGRPRKSAPAQQEA